MKQMDIEAVVKRLNSLVQCGCIDEEWPLLRHDTVHLIDRLRSQVERLRDIIRTEAAVMQAGADKLRTALEDDQSSHSG